MKKKHWSRFARLPQVARLPIGYPRRLPPIRSRRVCVTARSVEPNAGVSARPRAPRRRKTHEERTANIERGTDRGVQLENQYLASPTTEGNQTATPTTKFDMNGIKSVKL